MKYHHLGIPTKEKLKDEIYPEHLKVFVSGFGKIHTVLNGLDLKMEQTILRS